MIIIKEQMYKILNKRNHARKCIPYQKYSCNKSCDKKNTYLRELNKKRCARKSLFQVDLFSRKNATELLEKLIPIQCKCPSKETPKPWKICIFVGEILIEYQVGDSRQHWTIVCLGPIVFFQKVWKEKFWIFNMKLRN